MKQQAKRLLSMALVLVMVLSMLPVTAMAAGGTESEGSTKPSVADAFGFKTDPPAGFDAGDGVHPFSQSGTNDTINMVPVKEVGLLSTKHEYIPYNSSINVYNFGMDNLASFSDGTKLFDTKSSEFIPTDEINESNDTAYLFRLASGVAYDPTGSGRDDHVFYYGADASIQHNYSQFDWNYLLMQDFSYEGGTQGAVASGRLDPNEGNSEAGRAYDWAMGEAVDEAPDKYLSVTAGNFNGNGEETVVLYDPQFGHFTLQECSVNGENIQTSLVYDLGNEITVKNLHGDYKTYTLNDMVFAQKNNGGSSVFPEFMPLVHMTAGDLDGDEKDELVVTVTPLTLGLAGYYFDCVSTLLVFNKENDGAGNAVWNLKVSKTFNEEGKSVGGAVSAIGDFNNDNKNELVLVSEDEFIMMKYGNGSLTDLGETRFHTGGFKPTNSAIHPAYSLPAVGAARMDGTGTAPYLYISGEIFIYYAKSGAFNKVFDVDYEYMYDNPVRRQPIIGNFDGNLKGKEQIFTAVHGTKGNGDQVYGIECYSTDGSGPRLIYSYSDCDADALGRMVLTAPDADTDDGLVMRYTGKEYLFSNPEVMAVLLASPYFEDLLDDYENIGVTGFGTSNSTGSAYANTVSNTVGAYVSFSQEFSFLGMVDIASVEFQAAYNYEWSKTNEVSHTYETAISYEAGSGANQAVMIATPVILYHYDVLGPDGKPVATHEVSVSQEPCYTVIPVEDYNASAELLGNPRINSNCVNSVVPGQPQTYPSSKWQIDSYGGVTVPFATPVLTSQGNAVVSQEVDREHSQSLTQSYSHNIEVSGGAGAGGFVIGASYGHSWGSDSTQTVTSEVSRSGSVANIPAGNPDYSFKWQFATWDIQVGGYKVPVMGYIVNDVYQPPSVPQNLTATPGSDSVELTWDHGYNAAVKYDIFRYYPEEQEEYQYDLIGTVDSTETSFVCEGLNPSTRYYFTIRAVGERGLRSKYAEPVAVTTISANQKLPSIQEQPVDRSVNVSSTRQTTFSTLANPASGGTVTYAWECREDSSSAWETITSGTNVSGYKTRTLTVYNITESMDGTQYRCRVSERSGAPYPAVIYTKTATLTVGRSNTTTTLLSPTDGSYGNLNEDVQLRARVAASDNSACGGNVSFQITNTANGAVTTLMADAADATVSWFPKTPGVYTIRAAYMGNDTKEGSASETITYYVQESQDTPCYEIVLDGELVSFARMEASLKQWSHGQSTSVNGAAFELYEYNGTEFEKVNANWDDYIMTPGDFRIDAIVNGEVVAQKVFTVDKRPITITAPNIPSIVEGEPLDLAQYNDQIIYSYKLDEPFKSLFKLSGVTAKEPLSGQYDISVVYADSDRPEVANFLKLFQPTFEKSVFTVLPGSEATKCLVTFSSGVNGSLKAYVSATSTQEIPSAQKIPNGSTVFFSPEADDGYIVFKWTLNGTEVTQNAIDEGAFENCGNVRFSGDGLIVEGVKSNIDVTVEFTNQISTVTYSAVGNGSLTAKTSQGTTVQSGASLVYGASVVFTAVPEDNQMVKEWQITVNNGTPKTYTWPESGDIYRENTLTLSGLAEDSYTVCVEFTQKQTFEVAEPVMVDSEGTVVNVGTITMTDASGWPVSAGDEMDQGKAVIYTLEFTDSNFNTVNAWEYSVDGTNWTSGSEGGKFTYTCCKGSTGTLYVRAVVSVAQSYALSWKVVEDGEEITGTNIASLTAISDTTVLSSGKSYPANTPVEFALALDGSYYVVEWSNATPGENAETATLTLTCDTEVIVNIHKKPVVTFGAGSNGSVTAAVGDNTIASGDYVELGSEVTFTAVPNSEYRVAGWYSDAEFTAPISGTGKEISYTTNKLDADVSVYVAFELDTYTITFDTDGGTEVVPITEVAGRSVTKPADPAKTGYTFAGWEPAIPDVMPGEDMTIKAKWTVNQYTITFDSNGGTAVEPITQDYGTTVTAPENPTKTGYTFAGWDPEIPETMPAEDVTITAQWTINQYTITFDINGGSVIDPITQDYGTKVTAPDDPTKTGYTFAGWYTDEELTNAFVFTEDTTITEDITLYAKWNPQDGIKYTVMHKFENLDGETYTTTPEEMSGTTGTDTAAEAKSVEGFTAGEVTQQTIAGDGTTEIEIIYTRNQHTLTFKPENGDEDIVTTVKYGAEITAPTLEKTGYTFAGWDQEIPATMPDEDVTITAKWTINQYTITFKDGETTIDTITQDYGTDVEAPEDPTKTGYTFAGWDKEIPATMPAEDVTITAQWEAIQYTITLESIGEGHITANRDTAQVGADIDVTVTPHDDNHGLGSLTVTDAEGNDIPVEYRENEGVYRFKMPAANVTIKAVFVCKVHDTALNNAEEATCEEDGHIAYYVCRSCGLWFEDAEATKVIEDHNSVIIPAGHSYVDVVTDPTCTEQGYTTHTCSRCGDSYVDTYVDALGHTWDDGKVTKEATCTEDGVKTFTCETCGTTKTEVIDALGHNYQNGTCTNCGEKDPNAKPSWKDWFDKIFGDWWGDEETCDHVYTSVVTAPTCEEQGYTTHTCSECGDTYKDSYTDALGHTWDEGKVTKEATCTENGEKTFTCETCGKTKTEVIDALGHTFEDGICTECGEEEPAEPETPSQPSWKDWFDKIFGGWWG